MLSRTLPRALDEAQGRALARELGTDLEQVTYSCEVYQQDSVFRFWQSRLVIARLEGGAWIFLEGMVPVEEEPRLTQISIARATDEIHHRIWSRVQRFLRLAP
jgi:hypothetical protein